MKKYLALLMAAVLLLSLGTGVAAAYSQKSKGPAPTATPKSTVFKTVTVPSLENHVSSIAPCDQMTMEDNYYVMTYNNYGKSEPSLADKIKWVLVQTSYMAHLRSTGLFEEISREETDTYGRVALRYVGPGKLPRPFSTNGGTKQEAVTAILRDGKVQIYYSRDIRTSDLDQTMKRLGVTDKPKPTKKPTPTKKPSGKSCSICDGDGKCNKCGGDGWRYKTVLKNGKHDTVNSRCNGSACLFGKCTACGGDGRIN